MLKAISQLKLNFVFSYSLQVHFLDNKIGQDQNSVVVSPTIPMTHIFNFTMKLSGTEMRE
jgi:hypothetical protein